MKLQKNISQAPQRRLSPWRILLGVCILVGTCISVFMLFQQYEQNKVLSHQVRWYAPYVDTTATPTFAFEQIGNNPAKNAVLAFIVASPGDVCEPTWGGVYSLDQARDRLDMDRRIALLRHLGGNIVISFGGQRNHELSETCTNIQNLTSAYAKVVDRYHVDTIDLDIEGEDITRSDSLERRATALGHLQSYMRSQKQNLAIWLTLPVTPDGLTESGTKVVSVFLSHKVDIAGVNIMAMDYGGTKKNDMSMSDAGISALTQVHRQLGILYSQNKFYLSNATLWTKLGITLMIGQNDTQDEIVTLQDALKINTYAKSNNIQRISIWSANRDIQCSENYVDIQVVSDACSGIKQDKMNFTTILSQGFEGNISQNAGKVTKSDKMTDKNIIDDPDTSPYQIWQPTGAYLAGTKVVWHHYVYIAKWWTQGEAPDNPVLQSYQTPWQLVGPVLPGEHPIQQPTLPEGTYPHWEGTSIYEAGQRVLFNGIPYQAKWWNQGNSPAAASSNQDSSPWIQLTIDQINDVLKQTAATQSAQ